MLVGAVGDQARRSLGGFSLVAGEDVAVDLEGEGDVGVAEAFADHPRVLGPWPGGGSHGCGGARAA